MSALAVLWFFLIFVLIAGYFVLDGFDLGVGVLYRALAKDERERALVRRSIGPVWDGNEVWLLTAGGALFAAFPAAYATTFSGFYLAVMLVLFGLIVRAVSLEFRAHDPKWARAWDVCFTVGSFLPALLLGTRKAEFTPVMDIAPLRGRNIFALAFYGAYLLIPTVLHIKEALQWHISRSGI